MNSIMSVLVVSCLAALPFQDPLGYKIQTRYPVPGNGGFDYLKFDETTRHLYLSHETQVDVIDVDNGKMIGTITDTPGIHGIALAPEFNHGFTSNGRENKVSMFDPATLKLIKKIDVGQRPDGIYYDPRVKRVFTNNHGSHDISAIDAETGEVVGTVKIEGDGEQAIIGTDGLIYVNCEDTSEVVLFDPNSLEVKKRFPVGVAKAPTGLAYDGTTQRLFIACREEPKMVVMDATSGKVLADFPIGKGVDYACFDPDNKLAFFSCGEGTLNFFHETSADQFESAGVLKTQPSAKTMAFDPKTKKIYLGAVEYDESQAAGSSSRQRRRVKPDSFTVLVVGK